MIEDTSSIRLAGGDHVVRFYETEQDLVALVGSYLSASVLDGDTVIVIATPGHLNAFAGVIRGAGVDTAAAERAGRLVLLDAPDTLSRFMVDGMPAPAAFDAVVGALVREAEGSGRPVRAYGEMVALLWAAGNPEGAVELERLWNDLLVQSPLGLFCGYPSSAMAGRDAAGGFREVCDLHSHVVAGAPVPSGAETTRRFLAHPEAARRARRYVEDTLEGWGLDAIGDSVVIAAGELAANAVMHARGDFTIGLARQPGLLRLMVGDSNTEPIEPGKPRSMASGGRGVAIVASIADDWGYELQPGGKVVWADFDCPYTALAEESLLTPG